MKPAKFYFLLLGVLTLVLLFSQIYLQLTLSKSRDDATLINISGRQRMLSQMIAKLSLQLAGEKDSIKFEKYQSELIEAHDGLVKAHHYLKNHEDVATNGRLVGLFVEINPFFEVIDHSVIDIIDLEFLENANSLNLSVDMINENEASFLRVMDLITNELEISSVRKVQRMSIAQYILLGITILIIITEILSIFRPLIKQSNRSKTDFLNLSKIVDSLNNYAVFFMDLSGNVIAWTLSATNLKGYSLDEVQGIHHSVFYTDEERLEKTPEKLLQEAVEQGVAKYEGWILKKDGSRFWASKTIMTITDEKGKVVGFGNLTHDLTDFKKAEEIRIVEVKNREMEQFTYIASHDLQEPLRTISNYIQVIEEDHARELNEEVFSHLSSMKRATQRMSNLIKGLLDHSRLGKKSQIEFIDTNQLLDELSVDLKYFIEENNAHITVEKLPKLNGYPVELNQLFLNLIVNAIKFRKPEEDPKVCVSCKLVKNEWKFAVSDNGIGIKDKYIDRIFKIFQRITTSSRYEGYGIGLAHCQKIVQLHKGKIWVESEEGIGSTFYFTIASDLS